MLKIMSLLLGLLILLQSNIKSQTNATFTPFQGTVYDIPPDYLNEGYGNYVKYCDIVGHITLDSLVVQKEFNHGKFFPGLTFRIRYGIVFLSNLEISDKGCYEFSLESDDGSILWIADSLIVDNDKPHKMRIRRDTMRMDRGQYTVKVWYYNAFESQYGLILKSKALPDSVACKNQKSNRLERKLSLDVNNVLFDFNSYDITPAGMKELDVLCVELNNSDFRKIHVIGYTDNVGSVTFNEELSLRRAKSILAYMKTKLHKPKIIFEAEGRGSSNPVAFGENPDAQQRNRRVEIYID
ncbi:MAG: OmpA family protein [Saprospiraceae bacterium]